MADAADAPQDEAPAAMPAPGWPDVVCVTLAVLFAVGVLAAAITPHHRYPAARSAAVERQARAEQIEREIAEAQADAAFAGPG